MTDMTAHNTTEFPKILQSVNLPWEERFIIFHDSICGYIPGMVWYVWMFLRTMHFSLDWFGSLGFLISDTGWAEFVLYLKRAETGFCAKGPSVGQCCGIDTSWCELWRVILCIFHELLRQVWIFLPKAATPRLQETNLEVWGVIIQWIQHIIHIKSYKFNHHNVTKYFSTFFGVPHCTDFDKPGFSIKMKKIICAYLCNLCLSGSGGSSTGCVAGHC